MDIIICVSLKDCLIVKKNIPFIRKNIKAEKIYILLDKQNQIFFSKNYLHKYNVQLIDEQDIIKDRSALENIAKEHFTCEYRFGWYYQQFLKMGFALSSFAKDFYLIWDSDTIPLNELSFMEDSEMLFTAKTEHHKAYFSTLHNLIGYNKEVDFSFIAEHMIVSTSIMKELISKIESSEIIGNSWPAKIINATPVDDPNGFSEFETYGTYCNHHYPNLFKTREMRTFREAGRIYSRGISNRMLCRLSKEYDTISLENWATPHKFRVKLRNKLEIYLFDSIQALRTYYHSFRHKVG